MTLLDRLGDRVGDFLEEVMLPEEINALHQKARRAMERDEYERALRFLGEAEHRRPNTERTRRMRALCYFYLDDLDRAVELFEQALELRETAAGHFYLGLCHEKKSDWSGSRAHFRRALQIDEDPPFAYDLHFGLGRIHLREDRSDKAIRELRKALRIWPDQTDAALHLAEALRRREHYDDARETLHTAIGDTPERKALLTLGNIETGRGKFDAATDAFEQLLQRNPDDREALLGAARAHLAAGRPSKANQHLIRALDDTEEDAEIFALIGETNERIDNLSKARDSYESALKRDADHDEALLGAARTALQLGDHQRAADHFEHLLGDTDTDHRAEALVGLGRCRLEMADPVGARHLLEEAAHLHRTRPAELLHALGTVALQSDDPAEALVAFRRALDADDELQERLREDIQRALDALQPHWHRPETIDSTADLVETLTNLRDQVRSEPRLEAVLPRIHGLLNTLDNPLSVAVLGEFNAGKSTLVNALLGEKVVPMGVLPTTAHPCVMGYGPRKGARIVYEDDRVEDVDFSTARTKMKAEAEQIARLDYTYPHPELRSLNYLDTPGFNALDERHEKLAVEALRDAEAILWILDANQALTETEFSKLRSIPDSENRVILVVNKIDRFGAPDDRGDEIAEIIEYLDDSAGDQVLDVLAISALEALKSRTASGEQSPGTNDDFERLLRLLDEQFVQRSWQIKTAEVSRNLDELLEDIEAIRTNEIESFDNLIDRAETLGKLVDDAAGAPRSKASEHALILEDRFDFVTLGVEREIDEALRRRGQVFSRVVLEADDREFVLGLLRERLDDVIARTERDVLREATDLESELAGRLSPLFASLSVTDARPMRRRLEGFFDETRALKTILRERVFGRWRARCEGRIAAGGDTTLDAIVALGEDADRHERRDRLSELIPRIGDEFTDDLAAWYEEFFLAARRFCNRLRRDLTTLQLEVRHRLDFTC